MVFKFIPIEKYLQEMGELRWGKPFADCGGGQKTMCLSVPTLVVEVNEREKQAKVVYMGAQFTVGIALLNPVERGQYVLVHAGEAIQVVDEDKAMDGLALWKEMLGES